MSPTLAADYPHAAPFRNGGSSHAEILRSWFIAALLPAIAGVLLFGRNAAGVLASTCAAGVGLNLAFAALTHRWPPRDLAHVLLMSLLLGLTLPATVPWYVGVSGALILVCAKAVFGGISHCIWHPVLIGRVVVQFLFAGPLALSQAGAPLPAPVLTPGHLAVGRLDVPETLESPDYQGWRRAALDNPRRESIAILRPQQILRQFADGKIPPDQQLWPADPILRFSPLLRDRLPPWQDTILGAVPGGIGETCSLALIVSGVYLIYRGHLRWQLPVSALAAAALAAALLPVSIGDGGAYRWVPALAFENGRAVGMAYVFYHLTAGQLLIATFLLGGEMMLSPLRARGQVIFGAGIGALAVFLRLYGPLDGEAYWAILAMNSVVPMIDRRLKRPILGIQT